MALAILESCHVTSSRQEVNEMRFLEQVSVVTRSYRFLAVYMKSLIVSALITLEVRIRGPILEIFDDL